MKKIYGLVLVIYGIFAISYGAYNQMLNNNEEVSKDEDAPINDSINKDNNGDNNIVNDNYDDVVDYLNNKYNLEFEVIDEVSNYCLDVSEYNLYYSMPCNDSKVNNIIYKVKAVDDDFPFFVKKVIYDEEKIVLPEGEISNQSSGYYDNYMSYVVADKIEKSLIEEYKSVLGENIDVTIYEGIGIYDESVDNSYQYLDSSNKDIIDKEISIKDYIDTINNNSISISVKLEQDITSDNFKDNVTLLKALSKNTTDNISIEKMVFEYNNDNRYIIFDRAYDVMKLKSGKNKYSLINDSEMVYDKSICVGSGISSDCIFYDDFINLDAATFDF